jgi:hypothetical protein
MRSSLTLTLALLLCAGTPALADDAQARADAVEAEFVRLVDRVAKAFVVIGGGSGIIVTPDGWVLTNHHVAGSRKIGEDWQVILPGQVFDTATMVGTDERGDISLLKLKGEGPYPYVEMADSDLVEVGEAVLALGNPFGFSKDGTPHVSLDRHADQPRQLRRTPDRHERPLDRDQRQDRRALGQPRQQRRGLRDPHQPDQDLPPPLQGEGRGQPRHDRGGPLRQHPQGW